MNSDADDTKRPRFAKGWARRRKIYGGRDILQEPPLICLFWTHLLHINYLGEGCDSSVSSLSACCQGTGSDPCFLGTWKSLLFCFSQMPRSSTLWDCTLNSASQQSTHLHTTALNQTTRWQENLHTRKRKRETHSFWNSSCLLLSWLNLSFLSINL